MKRGSTIRATLIVMVLGCFVSAQQARSESVFQTAREGSLAGRFIPLPSLAEGLCAPGGGAISCAVPRALTYAVSSIDSTQAVEIEVPEAKAHRPYKEYIGIAIAAAVITYAAITILKPDKEETPPGGGGKEIPTAAGVAFSIPLSR